MMVVDECPVAGCYKPPGHRHGTPEDWARDRRELEAMREAVRRTPPPEPEPPAWDPDVEQALGAIGEQVGAAVTPLAVTLQETRQALVRMTPLYADLRDTLEAVLDVTARAGVNPSWVQDREILDHARDLIARTAPNGAPDADTTPDPATPGR